MNYHPFPARYSQRGLSPFPSLEILTLYPVGDEVTRLTLLQELIQIHPAIPLPTGETGSHRTARWIDRKNRARFAAGPVAPPRPATPFALLRPATVAAPAAKASCPRPPATRNIFSRFQPGGLCCLRPSSRAMARPH